MDRLKLVCHSRRCPRWVAPAPTKEDRQKQLSIIDFVKASTPEGRAELAPRVRDVMRTVWFMCVVNHGLTQSQTECMFEIGDVVFKQVSEEKLQYASKLEEDPTRIGHKPCQVSMTDNRVRDQHEQYAVHRAVFGRKKHPKALEPFLPELHTFAEHNHHEVLHHILRYILETRH
ncbi:hypothetical protein BD309DRAFT_993237 [Dichomitus squalens]|nr:hypothetical protein BD309DRAFT_993237 [Dichomitus squalens]